MRLIFDIAMLFIGLFSLLAQESRFSSKDGSYTFLIPKNYTHQEREIDNGTLDILIVNNEKSQFKYALTIAKVYTDNIFTDLLKPDYKAAYLQNCGCEVIREEVKNYPNFKGVVFTITRVDSGQLLKGFSVNTIRNDYLFNIVYMTSESTFDEYKEEFNTLLNSFEINEN